MIKMPKEVRNLNLVVNFIKEGKQTVAYSPALDLSTVGTSEADAKKKFAEIVQIFFQDIVERNVIHEVLSELGWKHIHTKTKSEWVPPVVTSSNLTVPVSA